MLLYKQIRKLAKPTEMKGVIQMANNTKWFKITVHPNKEEASTARARLIDMPNDSDMKGFAFWHPESMIRYKGKMLELSFPDTWEFKLKNNKNGKEMKASAQAMYEYWTDDDADIWD